MAVPFQGAPRPLQRSLSFSDCHCHTLQQGIYFFATHRFLWPLLRGRLLPCIIISLVVLPLLFVFTYLPQVAFLAIFQGRLAWFNAVFLVLGEGAVIVALLFEAFFVDEALVNVFDAVRHRKLLSFTAFLTHGDRSSFTRVSLNLFRTGE